MSFITLKDYAMGRDLKYPEEWELARPNAINLLSLVNALLSDLGCSQKIVVSSGFRPLAVNQKTANASKRSGHMTGMAIDLQDNDGSLRKLLNPLQNKDHATLLRKYNLFMEHPDHTPTWLHLDFITRRDRPSRVFIP